MINLIFADKPEARHLGQVGVFKMCNSLLISFALFGLILVLKLFPDTSVGTWLNKVLVDVPASWLLKVTAWKIVALGITIIGVLALVPAMPSYIALMTIGDATAYFEVFVATSTIAVTISWKSLLRSANRLAATLTANISPVGGGLKVCYTDGAKPDRP